MNIRTALEAAEEADRQLANLEEAREKGDSEGVSVALKSLAACLYVMGDSETAELCELAVHIRHTL